MDLGHHSKWLSLKCWNRTRAAFAIAMGLFVIGGISGANAQAPLTKPEAAVSTGSAIDVVIDRLPGPAQPEKVIPAIIGSPEIHVVQRKETLIGISRRHDLGMLEVLAVNPGIDPWVPGVGTTIVLPKSHLRPTGEPEGIIINLAELRLYYFPADGSGVVTSAVGVGRGTFTTPVGETTVVRKMAEPAWYPTEATRAGDPTLPAVVPPGPQNPLGLYALYLGWPTYLIHGTNKPPGVGRRVSRGCSWYSTARFCRAAHRNNYAPSDRFINLGFRPARSVP